MRTANMNYYQLLDFALGNKKYQELVDTFYQKYNDPQVDGFSWDDEIQLDMTYHQIEKQLGIVAMPVYMDIDSPSVDHALSGFEVASDKLPTLKHRYAMNTKMLRERLILFNSGEGNLTDGIRRQILNNLFESTENLIIGNHNALTYQRMQAVSTGKLTLDTVNNPRGIKGITFDFAIPAANIKNLTGNARWWTNASHVAANEGSAADPIQYFKDWIADFRKRGINIDHFEMDVDLYNDMLNHTKVLERIGLAMAGVVIIQGGTAASTAIANAQNMVDEAKAQMVEKLIGKPIKVIDSLSAVESFDSTAKALKVTNVKGFKETNVAAVPTSGQIGTIKSYRQLAFEGDNGQQLAWFDGGRTLLTTRYVTETKEMIVESEGGWLTVPSVSKQMGYGTVTV